MRYARRLPTETRSTTRQLLRLALPLMGSALSEIAMVVADGVLCAHISDEGTSLTALGFAVQVWFILLAPASAVSIGSVALISRAHGAGDTGLMNRTVAQLAQIAVLVGLVMGVIGFAFGHGILRELGASPEVADKGARYLQMLALAFPAIYLGEGCLAAALRSLGNSRLPFLCGIAGNLLNVVLAYALIFGHFGLPALGIVGAGLATAISGVAMVTLMFVAGRGVNGLRLRARFVVPDREVTRQILKIGLPALVEQLIFYGAMTSLIWLLARIDQTAVAAHSIGARAANLLMVPISGVAMATAAMVGKALGAGSVEDARRIFRVSARTITAIIVPIAVLTYFCAPLIAAAYDAAPGSPLEDFTIKWLHVVAIALVPQGLMMALEGLLLGAGASRTVMNINLSANLGLRVTLAIVLGLGTSLGAVGVWLSWPAALAVQVPLAYIAYRRGRWAITGVSVDHNKAA